VKKEMCLCLPASVVAPHLEGRTGFIPAESIKTPEFLKPENCWFIPRSHVETDPSFKQIIPYTVIRCRDQVAIYKRTQKAGESRLHDLYSIGFGGHVGIPDICASIKNDELMDVDTTIWTSSLRELEEEIVCTIDEATIPAGVIYDPSNEVGQVHFGLVQMTDAFAPEISANEAELDEVKFILVSELPSYYDKLESWSKFVADYLVSRIGEQTSC
jgi:predicted NUDIX family phosphoesterase